MASCAAPGDGIGQDHPATRGTLGAFAVTADQTPVAITAMHLVNAWEIGPGDASIAIVQRTSLADYGTPIGEIDRGTRTGVDAARVRLDDGVATSSDVPTIGDVRGWRWAAYPGDIGEGVRVYGARSGRLDGTIISVDVDFRFTDVSLDRTIVVSIPTAWMRRGSQHGVFATHAAARRSGAARAGGGVSRAGGDWRRLRRPRRDPSHLPHLARQVPAAARSDQATDRVRSDRLTWRSHQGTTWVASTTQRHNDTNLVRVLAHNGTNLIRVSLQCR